MDQDHARQPVPPADPKAVIRVLIVTLVLNVVNFGIKISVGLITRNLTVISDALHSVLDAINNLVGIIALKISFRPPDHNHPYGHRKFEALASLGIGAFITLTCWELLKTIFKRFWNHDFPQPIAVSGLIIGMIVLSLAVNIGTWLYESRAGKKLNSTLLQADAADTRSDILVTMLSFSSLLIASKFPWLDAVFSLVVAGFILWTGWTVIRHNWLLLSDAAQMDPGPVRQIVEGISGVKDCHAIRSHGMPDEIHLDLHIVVDPNLSAAETQAIESNVRDALFKAFPQIAEVAIHHQTEPPTTAHPITRQNPQ